MANTLRQPPDLARRVPRWAGIGLFLYASVYALSAAKSFLVPVVFAFLLSMVFAPLRRALERLGIGSTLSSFMIVLLLLCGLLGLITTLAMPVSTWIENAPRIEFQVQQKINEISRSMNQALGASEWLQDLTDNSDEDGQAVQVEEGSSVAQQAALLVPSAVAQLLFTFVLLFFLLAAGDMFYEKLVYVMPTFRDKRRAVSILHNAERKLSRYLATVTVINFGVGVAVGAMMFAYGMPSPLVFGIAAFILNFVPYLGALLVLIAAAVVALITFDWYGWSLIIAASYLLLSTIEGQLITPYFVGRSLRINTVVVFLAITFWAWLWSAVGMIVALPLLVAIRTICEHIEGLDHISAFLSERHAERIPNSRNKR